MTSWPLAEMGGKEGHILSELHFEQMVFAECHGRRRAILGAEFGIVICLCITIPFRGLTRRPGLRLTAMGGGFVYLKLPWLYLQELP